MARPPRAFRIGSIVWGLLLGGVIIFISGAALLPSTKSSRIQAERVKQMAEQRAREAAAAETAGQATARMPSTKVFQVDMSYLRAVEGNAAPAATAATTRPADPSDDEGDDALFFSTKSTILDLTQLGEVKVKPEPGVAARADAARPSDSSSAADGADPSREE